MAPRILSNVLTWMGGKLPPLTLHKKEVVNSMIFRCRRLSFVLLPRVSIWSEPSRTIFPSFFQTAPSHNILLNIKNILQKHNSKDYVLIATQCLKKSPKMYHLHFQSWHLLSNKYAMQVSIQFDEKHLKILI